MGETNTVRPEIEKGVAMLNAQRVKSEIRVLFVEGTKYLAEWFDAFMQENFGGYEVYFKRSRKNGVLKMENGVITFATEYKKLGDGKSYLTKGFENVWDGGSWILRQWYREDLKSVEDNLLAAFTAPKPVKKKEGKK